jgi:SP family sugar:H+ symporter-like MFS transporter
MRYWRETFSTGYINTEDQVKDVTSGQTSLIVSILSAGTFFGALTAAPTADYLGRCLGLITCNVVFCVSVVLQTIATSIPLSVAGRFFAGYWVGIISTTISLYQSETAPKWIRAVIVSAYQLAITISLLLAAIVNNATKDRNDTGFYRIPIAVQFA